jgi:hypothetical protein
MRVHFVERYFDRTLTCWSVPLQRKNWQLLAYFGPRHGTSFFYDLPTDCWGLYSVHAFDRTLTHEFSPSALTFLTQDRGEGKHIPLYAKPCTRTYSAPYSQVAIFFLHSWEFLRDCGTRKIWYMEFGATDWWFYPIKCGEAEICWVKNPVVSSIFRLQLISNLKLWPI